MKSMSLFGCLILFTFPAFCRSAEITHHPCRLDSIQNYVALGATGCTIGPYLFYDIQYSTSASGGASVPTVWVLPVKNNKELQGGALLTGLSLVANWIATNGGNIVYSFSVSIRDISGKGIPGGIGGYGGSPFPTTTLPPNQWGLVSYAFSDSNGDMENGSNLVNNFTCNSCISTGNGAFFAPTSRPQSMILSYTYEFSSGAGGLVALEEQVTGVSASTH